jgi:hypothetical protein
MAKSDSDAGVLRALRTRSETKRARKVAESPGMRMLGRADKVDNFFNVVQAGVSVGNSYRKRTAEGQQGLMLAKSVLRDAALPILWASAPAVAYVGQKGAALAETAAIAASKGHRAAKSPVLREALVNAAAGAKLGSTAFKVLKVAGVFGNVIQAGYGGYKGSKEDDNKVRGFFRGALETIDPSAIFLDEGYVERGYNAVFGSKHKAVKETSAKPLSKIAEAGPAMLSGAVAIGAGSMLISSAKSGELPRLPVTMSGQQKVRAHTRRDGKQVREHTRVASRKSTRRSA